MAGSALDAANPRREIASDEEFMLQVLPILSGIEAYSEHLLGRALLQYARDHRSNRSRQGLSKFTKDRHQRIGRWSASLDRKSPAHDFL